MDALKRAETNRQRSASETPKAAPAASELALEPVVPEAAAPASASSPLPELAPKLDALNAELAAGSGAKPAAGSERRPPPAAAKVADREAARQEAARLLFAAKQPARPAPPLLLIGGAALAAALAIGGYFWWQLQATQRSALGVATGAAVPAPAALPAPTLAAGAPTTSIDARAAALPPGSDAGKVAAKPAATPARNEPGSAPTLRLVSSGVRVSPPLARAYQALQEGRLDDARGDYDAVLKDDSRNVDALLGLAQIAGRQGRAGDAEALYLRALDANPADADAQAGLINLRGQSDPQQAESRLKTLLAAQPESASLNFALGNLLARQARWGDAQQAYFRAWAAAPDNADLVYNLAVSLDHLRQTKLALQHYRLALDAAALRPAAFDRGAAERRIDEIERSERGPR